MSELLLDKSPQIEHDFEAYEKLQHYIMSFRDLPEGWHYGEGRNAAEPALCEALKILHYFSLHGASAISAYPDIDGGILVIGKYQEHTLEVLCKPSGHTDMLHDIDGTIAHETHDGEAKDINQYLGELAWPWRLEKLFDSLIHSTITMTTTDSLDLPLKIHRHQGAEESLSLTPNVHGARAIKNAGISRNAILRRSPEHQSSFGEYQLKNCRSTSLLSEPLQKMIPAT